VFLSVLRMIGYMCICGKPIYCRFDRYKRYFLKFSLTNEAKVTHSTSVAVYGELIGLQYAPDTATSPVWRLH